MKLNTNDRHSVQVLFDAIELQRKKGSDYNAAVSRIKQADYYPNGVYSILDTVNAKVLRIYSVLAKMEAGEKENFESLKDSAIDGINYLSFLASWLDGRIDGQDPDRDIFNKPKLKPVNVVPSRPYAQSDNIQLCSGLDQLSQSKKPIDIGYPDSAKNTKFHYYNVDKDAS